MVLTAMTTRIVLFGIFPVVLAVREVRRKESLAPVAVVAVIGRSLPPLPRSHL